MKRVWAALLVTLLVAGALLVPAPRLQALSCTVATTADGRPYIAPLAAGPGSGKRIGFDNTHGETAGTADWVVDGGYSDMACALAGRGYTVEEIRAYPLTAAVLRGYQAVVFAEPNIPFTSAEEKALTDYVAAGGGLLLVADHYQSDRNLNTWDALEVFNGWRRGHYGEDFSTPYYRYNGVATTATYAFNDGNDWLATAFGLRFRFNAIDLVDRARGPLHPGNPADDADPGILPAERSFGLTAGVKSVATYAGATIAIVDPARAMGIIYPNAGSLKAWGTAAADDPVALYTDRVGSVACGLATYGGSCEGAYVAVARAGAGKVVAVGDSSLWEDETPRYKSEARGNAKNTHRGWAEFDHATLALNLIDWLTRPEMTAGIPQPLRQAATPEPYLVETIMEPIAEPWATPDPGYLWYDANTFKAGSYNGRPAKGGGGVEAWAWNPLPAHAYPGNTLAIFLAAEGLPTGDSLSTQAYLYVNGDGLQVSRRFDRSSGSYAAALTPQALAADASGRLQRWEFWELDVAAVPRVLSARVKAGGKTRLTQNLRQEVGGDYGYLLIEPSLGYSDGLHAALLARDGALDTAVRIEPGQDTRITLPAGNYILEIWDDAGPARAGEAVQIIAGETRALPGLRDTTPPEITAARTPPNAQGWNNSEVVVVFACADDSSGVAICPDQVTLSEAGAGQSVIAEAMDAAGNVTRMVLKDINIDLAPPRTSALLLPLWRRLMVSLPAADDLSGTAATYYRLDSGRRRTGSLVGIDTPGLHVVEFWSVDRAGNVEPTQVIWLYRRAGWPLGRF